MGYFDYLLYRNLDVCLLLPMSMGMEDLIPLFYNIVSNTKSSALSREE